MVPCLVMDIVKAMKFIHKCGTMDKLENFYKVKMGDGSYAYRHKPCRNAYMKKYAESRKGANASN